MKLLEEIKKIKEAFRQNVQQAENHWPFHVQNAYNCIIQHLFDPCLTVSWMKQQCRINGHNFAAKFRSCTRLLPNAFINHQRIRVAKLLLADARFEELPVSFIASEVGYSSISAFSKSFKRHTGLNPARWREENIDN